MLIYSPLLLPLNKTFSIYGTTLSNRQDLITISQIDPEVILALTAGIDIICKRIPILNPATAKKF
jgi:hypothetical protein